MVWPKLDSFFEVAQCMGMPGVNLAKSLESVLSTGLITDILTADKVALPKELMGTYWSAVTYLFACNDVDDEAMSRHGSVCQAMTGAIALAVVYDSLTSEVALAKVSMDAVVGSKEDLIHIITESPRIVQIANVCRITTEGPYMQPLK